VGKEDGVFGVEVEKSAKVRSMWQRIDIGKALDALELWGMW